MRTASRLYDKHARRRVYFTAYAPILHADQRLPPSAPPLVREHRLYQADWLVRRYGFGVEELIDPSSPNLDANIDPNIVARSPDAELATIAPRAILCPGAVAARSFMGHSFRLHKARGRIESTRWAPL